MTWNNLKQINPMIRTMRDNLVLECSGQSEQNIKNVYLILISLRYISDSDLLSEDVFEYDSNYDNKIKSIIESLKVPFPDIFNLPFEYTFNSESKTIKALMSIPYIYFSENHYDRYCPFSDGILGYLYENFQLSDRIIANVNSHEKGTKYDEETLKLKTQIFTPSWVVETIVQNSLVRQMISFSDEYDVHYQLKNKLFTYLRSEKIGATKDPRGYKILEPSVGTGNVTNVIFNHYVSHLVEYLGESRESAVNYAVNNIYGLDIDEYSVKIARFALQVKSNIYVNNKRQNTILKFYDVNIKHVDSQFGTLDIDMFRLSGIPSKYDIIVGNPPYGGSKHFTPTMSRYFKRYYPMTSGDLYTMFMDMGLRHLKVGGLMALITPRNWMFLSSSHDFRKYIINNHGLRYIFDFGDDVFDSASVSTSVTILECGVGDDVTKAIDLKEHKDKYKALIDCVYPKNIWLCDNNIKKLEPIICTLKK